MNSKKKRIDLIFITIVVVFILSMVPIFANTFFTHASADDYGYASKARTAWVETGSLAKTIKAAGYNTAEIYQSWQGSFVAVFLMSFAPHIFSPELYKFAAFFLIIIFMTSFFILIYTIIHKKMKGSLKQVCYIFIAIIFVIMQTIPSLVEGFMWFNGAWYYTFFFCLAMLLVSMIILFPNWNLKKKIIMYVLMILIAFLIGGGNYLTALMMAFGLTVFTGYNIYIKHNMTPWYAGLMLVIIATLVISAVAPGNAARQAINIKPSITRAFISTFIDSVNYIFSWSNGRLIFASSLLVLPVISEVVKKTAINFLHPIWMFLISFALFAAQIFPPIYAIGKITAGRELNHILYSLMVFWYANLINLIGYWNNKSGLFTSQPLLKQLYAVLTIFIVIFSFNARPVEVYRSYQIVRDFMTGCVFNYEKEMNERYKVLEGKSKNVELKDIQFRPQHLYTNDINADTNGWINKGMADFYGKDSVKLKYLIDE